MSSNVLPSAPDEEQHLYPVLPGNDFRMQKVNEVSAALNAEVAHYRAVAKKYKRTKKVTNWCAVGSTVFSTAVSSASLASALSVVGLPAAIPLGGVGGAFALASSGLIVASKKLDSKIKKHQAIVTLAIAKRDTVWRLHSKALADNAISDREFQLIMTEFEQYNILKEAVRVKLTRNSSQPDIVKIKKEVRSEMEAEFRKKSKRARLEFAALSAYQKMIVCFHMAAFLVNEYFFTPEWLREARDITRELVECMNNYS